MSPTRSYMLAYLNYLTIWGVGGSVLRVTVYVTLRRQPTTPFCGNQLMVHLGEEHPVWNTSLYSKKILGSTAHTRSRLLCCAERPGVEWPVARPVELSWAVPPAPRPIIIKLGLVGECLLYRRLETDNILDHFRTFLSSIMTWLKRSSGPGYIN